MYTLAPRRNEARLRLSRGAAGSSGPTKSRSAGPLCFPRCVAEPNPFSTQSRPQASLNLCGTCKTWSRRGAEGHTRRDTHIHTPRYAHTDTHAQTHTHRHTCARVIAHSIGLVNVGVRRDPLTSTTRIPQDPFPPTPGAGGSTPSRRRRFWDSDAVSIATTGILTPGHPCLGEPCQQPSGPGWVWLTCPTDGASVTAPGHARQAAGS